MHSALRKIFLLLYVTLALTGCDLCSSFDAHVISYVEAPATLEAMHAWAGEHGYVSQEEMRKPHKGNVACGHSAACVILVPILLADTILPARLKHGWVADQQGAIVYSAVFDLRGRLIAGRAIQAGAYQDLKRLPLDQLNHYPIVIVQTGKISVQGKTLTHTPVAILDQVRLDQMYLAALKDHTEPDARADLTIEALKFLKAEIQPALLEYYQKEAGVSDHELARILKIGCQIHIYGMPDYIKLSVSAGEERAATQATLCLLKYEAMLNNEQMRSLTPRVVQHLCSKDTQVEDAARALQLHGRAGLRLNPEQLVQHCNLIERRSLVRWLSGAKPDSHQLAMAMRNDNKIKLYLNRLDARQFEDRQALMLALDAENQNGYAIIKKLVDGSTGSATSREVQQLMPLYLSESKHVYAQDVNHYILKWLVRSSAPVRQEVIPILHQAATQSSGKEQKQRLLLARLLLGKEYQHWPQLVQALNQHQIRWHSFNSRHPGFNHDTLLAYGLSLSGCTRKEIAEAARAARKQAPLRTCAAHTL